MAGECVFCFGEVELIFKLAKDVVADSAVIAEVDGGLALDAREFANEIDAAGEGGGTMRGGAVVFGAFEALAIQFEHFLVGGGKILMVEGALLLRVLNRRFEHEGASFGLFTIGSFGDDENDGIRSLESSGENGKEDDEKQQRERPTRQRGWRSPSRVFPPSNV